MPDDWGDPRLPLRFWAKVKRRKNGCWHWTAFITDDGYGRFNPDGKGSIGAHRWAYHVLVESLPAAKRGQPGHLQVDHQCHNRSKTCAASSGCLHRRCVNPAHLRAVPARTNILAGKGEAAKNAVAEFCVRGHALEEGNLYRNSSGGRQCRRCQIDRRNERRRLVAAERTPQPHYQTIKTHCPQGHPYSGNNLIERTDGGRSCRECSRAAGRRFHDRKRGGPGRPPNAQKTHCIRDHPLTGDNLYVQPSTGKRGCRTCMRARGQRVKPA